MSIFDNLGITINLTEMPEHKDYAEYYLNRSRLVKWYLRKFKLTKVQVLQLRVRCALLNAVLGKGSELIADKPTDIPLATLDVMEHNGRHTE